MGAGGPQNSDTLDSFPHGPELEWALQLHDGCSGQPDWESLLVSASYSVDGPEGCLRLESASSCLQEVAVDAAEETPGHRLALLGREGLANGKGRGGGHGGIATTAPARGRCLPALL